MRMINIAVWSVAVGLALGLGVGLASQARAQYPPPIGSVVLASESTTPGLGEEIEVRVTVQDETGAALAGVDCTFHIAQQPGDDATVDAGPFTTDGEGEASTALNSGSTEGVIVVEATCGELSAQVSIVAGDEAAPPASLPDAGDEAAPPASLPDTGSGGKSGSIYITVLVLITVGLVLGLGGLTVAWRRVR